jgi:DNA invertase Pin-like site-specific DNA recombinase
MGSSKKNVARPKAYSYIRMSTAEQVKGSSLRRQIAKSREYAEEHRLDLVDGRQIIDKGLSAFTGANITRGALGAFLDAVGADQIPPGSFLLVESLDRLSRQNPWTAQRVLGEIIDKGITVVTLSDGKRYTKDSINLGQLLESVIISMRSHEESALKQKRLKDTWDILRSDAHEKKITAICPAWLKLVRNNFEIIEERSAVIRRIYDECCSGMGDYTIAQRLNAKNIPTFGRSKGWHKSYVCKILTNRAVLGEMQFHELDVKGKRRPKGPPIANYYPPIVDEELYYRAQSARNSRRLAGGRKGKNLSSLFSGIVKCAYCGSTMCYVNKGKAPKGGQYLVCDRVVRGLGCEKAWWRYDHFETSFLASVSEVGIPTLLQDSEETKKRLALSNTIDNLRGRIVEKNSNHEETYKLYLEKRGDPELLLKALDGLKNELGHLRKTLQDSEAELHRRDEELAAYYEGQHEITELLKRIQTGKPDDLYKIRAQLAARLKAIIREVRIAGSGGAPFVREQIAAMRSLSRPNMKALRDLEKGLDEPRTKDRFFAVFFKNGSDRNVVPHPDDPMRFLEQLTRDADGTLTKVWGDGSTEVFSPNLTLGRRTKMIKKLASEKITVLGSRH